MLADVALPDRQAYDGFEYVEDPTKQDHETQRRWQTMKASGAR